MSSGNPQVIEFQCPSCSKRLKAGPKFAGKRVKCPQCSTPVQVPELPEPPKSEATKPATPKPTAPAVKPAPVDDWLSLDAPVLEKTAPLPTKPPAFSRPGERVSRTPDKPASPTPANPAANLRAEGKPRTPADRVDENVEDEFGFMKADAPAPTEQAKGDVPRRSVFDDDLPDLAELDAAPKKPHRVTDILQIDGLDDIVAAAPLVRPKQPVQPAEPKPSEIDYRVTCRTCGTPLHMKLDRVGKKISCPDCHSSFVVPPPPPGWSPAAKQSPVLDDHADVPLAPNEALTPVRLPETQRTVASEYLDKAKQELDDEELESLYDGDFDTSGFMTRTFGFFTDPSAVGVLIMYGFILAGIFGVAALSKQMADKGGWEGSGYLLILYILVTVVCILVSLPLLSAGLALLESVANRQRRVAEWPLFNIIDNFGEILVVLVALAGSILPGFLIGGMVERSGGSEWMVLLGMIATCFLLFPILMLSMLDNGSPLQPISGSVITSIPQAAEAWGGYYLKTLTAFGMFTVLCLVLLGRSPVTAAIVGFFVPTLLFFTCQQLGALADSIADHLSFDFSPPASDPKDKEDEDKSASGKKDDLVL